MANPASLFGNSKSDGFGGLSEILGLLLEFKDSGGKVSDMKGKTAPAATPSAAPVGQPTATAGVSTQQAPVPLGAPPSVKSKGGSFMGGSTELSNVSSPMSAQTTGGGYSGGAEGPGASSPAQSGQGGGYTQMGGTTQTTPSTPSSVPPSSGGYQTGSLTEAGAAFGPYGAAIGAVGDVAMTMYDAFSLDEQEKAQRAQRHLMEQQFEMRANFNDAYYRYFLPAQAQSKQYAGQQLGKGSENYDYASTALKGYIEGSAGVFGGQKDWEEVFQDIGADLEGMDDPPEDWMSAFQSHLENDTVPFATQELVNQVLKEAFKMYGIPDNVGADISQAIVRWGGAMIGASKDMRNKNTGDMYRGSI